MTPVFLSANAPKQNTFAVDASQSSSITFGLVVLCIGGCIAFRGGAICGGITTGGNTIGGTTTIVGDCFGVVLLIP
jgi:hypothetical protein